jgi:hypothetical protein
MMVIWQKSLYLIYEKIQMYRLRTISVFIGVLICFSQILFGQPGKKLEFSIRGTIYADVGDSIVEKVPGAIVTLIGSDGSIVCDTTDSIGIYFFDSSQVRPNIAYIINSTKKCHYGAKAKVTTIGTTESKAIVQDLTMIKLPPSGPAAQELRFRNDSTELQPSQKRDLDYLAVTLKDNPTLVIAINAYAVVNNSALNADTVALKRVVAVQIYLVTKGIEEDRLKPVAQGDKNQRTLNRNYEIEGITFKKGTLMSKEYLESLKSEKAKYEAAILLCNYVSFAVISTDYIHEK